MHLLHGYVFSTPSAFIMMRPVEKDADYMLVTNPEHHFQCPDAWLVYLAAGNLSEFFQMEPFPLPYIGFERSNKLRYYRRSNLKRVCESITRNPMNRMRGAS